MRRTMLRAALLACGAFGLASACSSEKVGPPPAPPVNWNSLQAKPVVDAGEPKATEREAAIASAYTKALGDFGGLPALLDETVNMRFGKQIAHGRESVVKLHDTLFGAFSQRSVVASRVWLTESFQAIELTISGTQTREWMGVAPTQKPAAIKCIMLVWTQDAGTISEVHLMFDVNSVKAQLTGAAPLPAANPPHVFEATNSLDEMSNKAMVRSSINALESLTHTGSGDAGTLVTGEAGYLSTFTDDVEIFGSGKSLHGKDDARAYFRTMRGAISQLDTMVINTFAAGPFVVVEYTINGEQVAPLSSIPFTRSQLVALNVIDVVELKDGKIWHVWRYDNPFELSAPKP